MSQRCKRVAVLWVLTLAGVCLPGGAGVRLPWMRTPRQSRAARGRDSSRRLGGRAPRDEIRPEFGYQPHGALDGRACLIIKADNREGLAGFWKKVFAVTGGKTYRFQASYLAKGVRRAAAEHVAEVHWRDCAGPAGSAG